MAASELDRDKHTSRLGCFESLDGVGFFLHICVSLITSGLKSVTPPRGHFCHLFMGCVGRAQRPDWLSTGFEQPVAITGQT